MSEVKKKKVTKAKKIAKDEEEPRRSGRKREAPERLIEDLSPKRKRAAPERSPKPAAKKKQKKTVKATTAKSPAKKKKKLSSSSSSSSSESEASDSDSGSEKKRSPKRKKNKKKKAKAPMQVASSTLKNLKKAQHDALLALSVPDLKKRLTANDQVSSGSKSELQLRIADCIVNGSFPRCPKCFGGKIKQSGDDEFFCPGSYEDDHFVRCSWTGAGSDIKRVPWKTEDSEEI